MSAAGILKRTARRLRHRALHMRKVADELEAMAAELAAAAKRKDEEDGKDAPR